MELDYTDEIGVNKGKRRKAFKDVISKRMLNKFGAVPWTFMKERDPAVLQKFNGFGHSMFVVRHNGKVNRYYKEIFKDVVSNDPGLKFFKVYRCMGTGDQYYFGNMESDNIRSWQRRISNLQHIMDLEIDKDQTTIDLKNMADNQLNLNNWLSDYEPTRIGCLERYNFIRVKAR
jgi:hypothetical protein